MSPEDCVIRSVSQRDPRELELRDPCHFGHAARRHRNGVSDLQEMA